MTDGMSKLAGRQWVLGRLEDPAGRVGPAPTGEEILTFDANAVTDNHQNAAAVRIAADTINFGEWANGAVGIHSEGHSSAPLTAMEQRFLFSVLAGATTWTTTGQELVIRKASVGSARFAEATER